MINQRSTVQTGSSVWSEGKYMSIDHTTKRLVRQATNNDFSLTKEGNGPYCTCDLPPFLLNTETEECGGDVKVDYTEYT